ncbi:ead/Ea22-like family protein [Escherichia coli]|nr:ead/Ea22-like family protein [Escherichia coli]MCN8187266.1 ead/Ea22-like family protein [Escherichia coli]HAL9114594.1 ead/Ea22-like family protein [Escherichia coli]HAX8445507.1 ead/Ea22-like family protein [Escherichia coli]HCO3020805.1 ead/Ea22-like family protein [Escherichia coli]
MSNIDINIDIDIDTLALREAAQNAKDLGGIKNYKRGEQAVAEFESLITPHIVLALLDERERNQQYIKRRDQENEDIALTVGKLRVELEAEEKTSAARLEALDRTHKMFQREQCRAEAAEKRIAELEKSEEQLINERDHAESALADMYFAATGDRPEWSNWFGFSDAVDAVVDRIADLEAKQPSPVVPEGLIKAVRFYEQVKRENPPVETGAWKDAVDWVLEEACQAVNTCIKG